MFKEENIEKGKKFEQFVINLIDLNYFKINNYNRDNYNSLHVKIETDSDPDITIRHLDTNQLISLECKFRQNMYNNKIRWAFAYQIRHYNEFSVKNNRPTFIVIGLGGYPDRPDKLYCIPLEHARLTNLDPSAIEKFKKPLYSKFTWQHNTLI